MGATTPGACLDQLAQVVAPRLQRELAVGGTNVGAELYLCGLNIIWGLQPDSLGHWSSSWLYEPQNGVTCDITAELTTLYTISRVYRGVPLLGRTEILIRDPELTFDGRC